MDFETDEEAKGRAHTHAHRTQSWTNTHAAKKLILLIVSTKSQFVGLEPPLEPRRVVTKRVAEQRHAQNTQAAEYTSHR